MDFGKIKLLTGNANIPLAQEISDCLGIPLVNAEVTSFPNDETYVKINENIRGCDVFIIQPTCNPANQNLMELLIMIDTVRRASASRITAVMPFYGYARQDRKDKPRVPITSKLVANLLVSAGADRILTMDLHSPQIGGFFDIPVDHLTMAPVFYNYLVVKQVKDLMVVSPDVGGTKVATQYADLLGCPLGIVAKRRNDAENVEALHVIGDVAGKNVLLVDDMSESGGTLVSAAKTLKENDALSVSALVAHGVLNKKGYERISEGELDQVITSNSTPVKTEGYPITVISIAKHLSEAIMRINHNESVSSLYKVRAY